jgi:hypothetical protein
MGAGTGLFWGKLPRRVVLALRSALQCYMLASEQSIKQASEQACIDVGYDNKRTRHDFSSMCVFHLSHLRAFLTCGCSPLCMVLATNSNATNKQFVCFGCGGGFGGMLGMGMCDHQLTCLSRCVCTHQALCMLARLGLAWPGLAWLPAPAPLLACARACGREGLCMLTRCSDLVEGRSM